jgi:hypothetical protein
VRPYAKVFAVAVLGTVMALGLVGPDLSLWLTAVPAAGAELVIAAVLVIPRLGVGVPASPEASRIRKARWQVRKALVGGTREAAKTNSAAQPKDIAKWPAKPRIAAAQPPA